MCALCASIRVRPTESVNRTTALGRLDLVATPNLRLFSRVAISRIERRIFELENSAHPLPTARPAPVDPAEKALA